jgi:hypothetical protein
MDYPPLRTTGESCQRVPVDSKIVELITPFAKVYTDEAVAYDGLSKKLYSQGRQPFAGIRSRPGPYARDRELLEACSSAD